MVVSLELTEKIIEVVGSHVDAATFRKILEDLSYIGGNKSFQATVERLKIRMGGDPVDVTIVRNRVFLDTISHRVGLSNWKVNFNGRICSPDFNSEGAAKAYLELLESGKRKPE